MHLKTYASSFPDLCEHRKYKLRFPNFQGWENALTKFPLEFSYQV